MDRLEIPVNDETESWVAAVERGEEVVLVRDGRPVAALQPVGGARTRSLDKTALSALRRGAAQLRVRDAARLIRRLRDASDH